MALPSNAASSTAISAPFLAPDDIIRSSLLVDYELAGADVNDPSQGLQVQNWEARLSGNAMQCKPVSGSTWTTITSVASVTELALAFDQNMRPAVAYVAGGVAYFYWYDTTPAAYVTTTLTSATSPICSMDDKRLAESQSRDMILCYIRAGTVYYRQQRDRFTIERSLGAVPSGKTRIRRWGMSEIYRFQLEFS